MREDRSSDLRGFRIVAITLALQFFSLSNSRADGIWQAQLPIDGSVRSTKAVSREAAYKLSAYAIKSNDIAILLAAIRMLATTGDRAQAAGLISTARRLAGKNERRLSEISAFEYEHRAAIYESGDKIIELPPGGEHSYLIGKIEKERAFEVDIQVLKGELTSDIDGLIKLEDGSQFSDLGPSSGTKSHGLLLRIESPQDCLDASLVVKNVGPVPVTFLMTWPRAPISALDSC